MTNTYIGQIIEQVNAVTKACGPVLLFGENIDTGSRIAGLARGLTVNPSGHILNVGNCELTHCGVGFGIMMDRGNAVLFMKQLDFLLLGLDQLVNTFNVIRTRGDARETGSFTIFLIVCDQGYQGPQSSMNSASDFASLANIDVFCLNAAEDAAKVVADEFVSAGFRCICLSQRLFGAPALDLPLEWRSIDNAVFRYRSGNDVTLACFNFALRDGIAIADRLSASGVTSDLFHVNFSPRGDLDALAQSCGRTGKLVLIDDSKSVNKFGDALVTKLSSGNEAVSVLSLTRRGCADRDYGVGEDRFVLDHDRIAAFVESGH